MDKSNRIVSRRDIYYSDGIIALDSEAERLAITEPLANKIYAIEDRFWRWIDFGEYGGYNENGELTNGVWVLINNNTKASYSNLFLPCYYMSDDESFFGYNYYMTLSTDDVDEFNTCYECQGATSFSIKLVVETAGTLELLIDESFTKTLTLDAGEAWYNVLDLAGLGVDGRIRFQRTGGTSAGVYIVDLHWVERPMTLEDVKNLGQ